MSDDPTLVVRFDLDGASLPGDSCHAFAGNIASAVGITALDATWSHPADKFTAGEWPRCLLADKERAMVAAADALVGAEVAVPAALVRELVTIIRRVAHA